MFISCAQNKILKSFKCERLTSNLKNKDLIKNVSNSRNPKLVKILQNEAWDEDLSGECIYYLIKQNDEIALFFSLRTGLLFNKPVNENDLQNTIRIFQIAISARQDVDNNTKDKNSALNFLRRYGLENLTLSDLQKLLNQYAPKKNFLVEEKKTEINKLLYHVEKTYPGIELYIFCNNEDFKPTWQTFNFEKYNTIGSVFFWKFIIEKVYEIQNIVGCKYFYLFAADNSVEESLISYYTLLSFERNEKLGTNKPYFDWQSKFMCQEISQLHTLKKQFFLNFNPEPDIPVI